MIRVFGHYIPRAFLALILLEIVTLLAAFYLGVEARFDFHASPHQLEEISPIFPKAVTYALVMFTAMTAMGLHSRNIREGAIGTTIRLAASLITGLLAMVILIYLFPNLFIGRGALAWIFLFTAVMILLVRLVFLHFVDMERLKRRILVLGAGERAAAINRLMRRRADRRGIVITGYVRLAQERAAIDDHIIEHERPLRELVREYRAEEIVIAVDDRRNTLPIEEIVECRVHGIEVFDLVSFIERQCGKVLLDSLHPSWLIFSEGFRYGRLRDVEKHVFDVTASLLLLAVTWPAMLLTAVAILIESGGRGPILYRQERVGLHARPFQVLKFRSMTVDAEKDGVAQWASADDARVTRVGAIIRKFRIDELPQLFNVLIGDMSFVGPRPERPEFVRSLSLAIPYYGERHRVKPGITGWAQITYPYGASEKDASEKLQYDLYYVKNYSLFLDLIILLQTAQAVFWGRGAR